MKNISNNAKLSLDHIRRGRGRACDLGFHWQGGISARGMVKILIFSTYVRAAVGRM